MAGPRDPSTNEGEVPIPEPSGVPFLGNIGEFKSEDSLQDLLRLHDAYGDIYRLRFPGSKTMVLLGSQELINEACDESRFCKSINSELGEVRHLVNDGLFTAKDGEENWGIAHRILLPAFGPVAIREMFPEMLDVVTQLVLKWARHGAATPIAVTEDFTRLALDTIALCSMNFRFNSFYRESLHPFVHNMGDVLVEAGNRYSRPAMAKLFYRAVTKKFHRDIKQMRDISDEIVQKRRVDTSNEKRDLLAAMMNGVDPKTGKKMSDSSITDNLITFLIAGHETTSGTLSFFFYEILKNPDCYLKAQEEVDEVMGRDPITIHKIFKLKYIPAALRETLRLCSPIPGITVEPLADTLLGGKYHVHKGEVLAPFFTRSHLDPRVYGEDADKFKPERMLDENSKSLQKEFPNCWKPFGNGSRACIGRPFAWQEMLLAVSILLQNFTFSMDDPKYRLRLVETLTIKPKDLRVRASLRHGMSPLDLEHRLSGARGVTTSEENANAASFSKGHGCTNSKRTALRIFYGSNSGTCETLARRLAADAPSQGFRAEIVESLDQARDSLRPGEPVIIVTSSYEGQPPDNAAQFVSWLCGLKADDSISMAGVQYAVYGVGNREWARTFHRIPKLIDSALADHGAERITAIGLTDTHDRDSFTDFESWEENALWPALKKFGQQHQHRTTSANLEVQVLSPRCSTLRQDLSEAIVADARALCGPTDAASKRHLEIKLPTNTSYRAGDYLCVLPISARETVARAFRRFRLSWDAVLLIVGERQVALPMKQQTSAWDIFSAYLELGQPATRKDILTLAEFSPAYSDQQKLGSLAGEQFDREIMRKRTSILDLLELFPNVQLPLELFLTMLPPMRIRQYSISSSPLMHPHHVSITYSVLDEPSLSGQGRHMGVATTYLSQLSVNDMVHVAVRPSHTAFHLPLTPGTTPIICVAAGTGIGPFRGFIQERSAQIATGRHLAPAVLFFACRSRADDLYREEFDWYEEQGAVVIKRAYSRETETETDTNGESAGCKYVQHRMMKDKETIWELWEKGAKLYVCGSREVGAAVETACVGLLKELKGLTDEAARKLLEQVRNERFVMDIFT
ncbi:bifunctional cytochrome P450/NADPH--P450 reductase [Aspergillus undulatus]|uniref:bifunctional cytochrome P450/NADPH--P450 reductase n=1 Tax=Aspergillus undulatus TaxID=1810928 RepID=UPI003CCE3EE2